MSLDADALIVVDMQRGCLTGPHAVDDPTELVAVVSSALARARAAGALVVHLQNDGTVVTHDAPGTSGWELYFARRPDEPVVRKRHDDGFVGTHLADILRGHGVVSAVLCGVQSEMCVAATARAVLDRGIRVLLPRDAHGTFAIPADDRGGLAVPAACVKRVAEWSLGDRVVAPASLDEVTFVRAVRR